MRHALGARRGGSSASSSSKRSCRGDRHGRRPRRGRRSGCGGVRVLSGQDHGRRSGSSRPQGTTVIHAALLAAPPRAPGVLPALKATDRGFRAAQEPRRRRFHARFGGVWTTAMIAQVAPHGDLHSARRSRSRRVAARSRDPRPVPVGTIPGRLAGAGSGRLRFAMRRSGSFTPLGSRAGRTGESRTAPGRNRRRAGQASAIACPACRRPCRARR